MQMVKKESILSPAAIECWQTTSDPGDWNKLSGHKTTNGRRKRLEFQRLKSTHQNVTVPKKDHFDNDSNESKVNDFSSEISLSLSLSSSPASSSSDHSSESDVIMEEKSDFGYKPRKKSDNKSFTCEPYGAVSVIGRRREMEDTVTVELNFLSLEDEEMNYENINYDFFAVYDGHSGSRVAEACRKRLHNIVAKEAEEMAAQSTVERKGGGVDWEKVMAASFEKMDEEVNGSDERFEVGRGAVSIKTIGSTAVVAVVGKEKVVVANCGDCRAVICRGGEAVALSNDHKPERPDELERVEAAGGRVIYWNGHRVLGVLATSRSIGDHYLKPFVTSEPEVRVWERSDSDEFLILASDGLWDVVTNEVACQIVRRCLDGRMRRRRQQTLHKGVNESRAAEAASVLSELAMSRGSKDNISVIVVELRKRRDFS